MTVRGPQMTTGQAREFYVGLYAGQQRVSIAILALGGVIIVALWSVEVLSTAGALIAAATAIAILGALKREFVKAWLFIDGQAARVLVIDLLYCAVVAATATVVFGLGLEAAVAGILFGMGLGSLPAAFGRQRFDIDGSATARVKALESLRVAWKDGRWTLPGVLITFSMSHAHTYLLAAVGGLIFAAEVGAARMLLMPVAMLNLSLYRVLRPRWAGLLGSGSHGVIRLQRNRAIGGIGVATALFALLLYASWDLVVSYVITPEYGGIWMLVVLWAIFFAGQSARVALSNQLQVYSEYRYLTSFVAIAAILVVGATLVLVPLVGAAGVVYAMIAGEVLLLVAFGLRSASLLHPQAP